MPKKKKLKRPFLSFVVLSTLIFLVLFSITGLSFALEMPSFISLGLQAFSAWSSTIAFVILYKRIYPNIKFMDFLKRQFANKLKPVVLLLAIIIPIGIFMITSFAFALGDDTQIFAISYSGIGVLLGSFLFNLVNGPLGEQLGWRAFALNELQKKYSPLIAALIVGLFWGLWHFPLWFISGYTGIDLIQYILLFMITIISFSVVMTWLYNLNRNLIIPIILHLLFNFLTTLIQGDLLKIFYYISIGYLIIAVMIVLIHSKMMLKKNTIQTSRSDED